MMTILATISHEFISVPAYISNCTKQRHTFLQAISDGVFPVNKSRFMAPALISNCVTTTNLFYKQALYKGVLQWQHIFTSDPASTSIGMITTSPVWQAMV